ncbi:MAG: hypothetical protein HRU23_20285 [Gammaproteobacteria bacterium]|nr:hypothetical protein [Gammaproteobacteria bacterium]
MHRPNEASQFHINVKTAYQEQIRPEKSNGSAVERRRRIEELEEQKQLNKQDEF